MPPASVEPDPAPRRHRTLVGLAVVLVVWIGLMIAVSPPRLDPIRCDVDHVPDADTVVMLSAAWCRYCRRARAFMQAQGITHCEYDVEQSDAGRRLFEQQPVKVVPVLMVRDDIMVGFNRDELMQALVAHGIVSFGDYE